VAARPNRDCEPNGRRFLSGASRFQAPATSAGAFITDSIMRKDNEPLLTFQDVSMFFDKYRRATVLLNYAARDYAAARCLLLNMHFPGLALGAETIEKYLKAYILIHDPTINVRQLNHNLGKLLQRADKCFPTLNLLSYANLIERFRGHYQTRYPDNPDASPSMTTADLLELDEMVIFLNENLPCPKSVRYRTGFYAQITFSLGPQSNPTPCEVCIKQCNEALTPLLPRIADDYAEVIRALYQAPEDSSIA
jgi:hypothetical protein